MAHGVLPLFEKMVVFKGFKEIASQMVTSESVIAVLQERVHQRRMEGKYPHGLEQQLEAEFKNIMEVVHRGNDVLGNVQALLTQCKREIENLNQPVPARSRIPGFGLIHWIISKIVGRQTSAVANRVRQTLETQQQVLELLLRQLEIQQGSDVRMLNQLSHAMQDRLMMIDVLAQSVIELEQKVSKGS
jgi:hypothetical protein